MLKPFCHAALVLAVCTESTSTPVFHKVQLDPAFRSEGVALADVNRDGQLDVLAGDLWYEAPSWTPHAIKTPATYSDVPNQYSDAFIVFASDINGDGWVDEPLQPGEAPAIAISNKSGVFLFRQGL